MRSKGRGRPQYGKGGDSAEIARRREEFIRPWPTLGYDHDRIALHLLEREVLDVAESELRRAVWLNPYEPAFKRHLAWCLHRAQRHQEAKEWLLQALQQEPASPESAALMGAIERALAAPKQP